MQRSTPLLRAIGPVLIASVIGCSDPSETAAPVDLQATVDTAVQATVRALAPTPTRPLAVTPMPVPAAVLAPLDNDAIQQALGASGFPIGEVRTFTAETDPNSLLGRPNQYTVKVSWKDARAPFEGLSG
jgi:hypothetical protein